MMPTAAENSAALVSEMTNGMPAACSSASV